MQTRKDKKNMFESNFLHNCTVNQVIGLCRHTGSDSKDEGAISFTSFYVSSEYFPTKEVSDYFTDKTDVKQKHKMT